MKWIVFNNRHLNLDMVHSFWWKEEGYNRGYLYVDDGGDRPAQYYDPYRKLYFELCSATMQNPLKG